MLQFDARVTARKYDETTGKHSAEFDWSGELADEVRKHLEFALENTQVLIRENNEIYVFTISNISRVD